MKLLIPFLIFCSSFSFAQKEGDNLSLFDNGETSVYFYIHEGLKEGWWKEFYSDGQIKKQGEFQNNQKQGWWRCYKENGEMESEGHYVDGQKDGYCCVTENGMLAKGHFSSDQREDWWEFYPNKEMVKAGYYFKGVALGQWGEKVDGKWLLIEMSE